MVSMAMKQEDQQKSYWAFISYSSKDEAVARRLHRALEHYRMPRDLVGRPMRDGEPAPKRLFPVFRDRDELPLSADLGNAIESALRASRYLIVLCSPSAATSRWVNEEIRYFKSIGGDDRILAIIVSGEPNASDKAGSTGEECFPPALRFHVDEDGRLTDQRCEPIAGDLRKGGDGWTACLLKAVAGITGLGLAAFTKRETVRVRRRRILTACAALLLVGGATAWWDYTRTKVAYYAHLTEHFGLPAGAIAVASGDLTGRSSTYRVESSRGKVRRVLHINGSGFPVGDVGAPFKAAFRELIYREDGSLQTIHFRSPQGRVAARREFSQPRKTAEGSVIIAETKAEHDGAPIGVGIGTRKSGSDKAKTEASTIRSIYGEDGLPFRVEYLNIYRNPAMASDGATGRLFEYNKDGLQIETIFLGRDAVHRPNRSGVQRMLGVRDKHGNLIERSFFSGNERPVLLNDGYAKVTAKYDGLGNQVETSYLGTDGQLVLHKNGFAKRTAKFDERGNEIEAAFFDKDSRPVLTQYGYAKKTARHDERGNEIETAFLGLDGQQIAKSTAKFDERGNMVETSYLDKEDQPVLRGNGYARVAYKFDNRGNRFEIAYFGTDGQPVLTREGVAKVTFEFDERDNIVGACFFGTDGRPVLHKDGNAKWSARYDGLGNQVETSYFGTDGAPVLTREGIAKATFKFDESGNAVETSYFGKDGQPVLHKDGYAVWNAKYDSRGNMVEATFLGTEGQPALHKEGFAKATAKFDEYGNEVEMAYFGTDGQPAMITDGYAKVTSKFDERGNEIEAAFFDKDGRPVMITNGWLFYAKWTAKFDERGSEIEKIYFDTDGKVIKN
jgi:hypothetical protein